MNATHNYSLQSNTFTDLGRPLVNGGVISIQGIAGTGEGFDAQSRKFGGQDPHQRRSLAEAAVQAAIPVP